MNKYANKGAVLNAVKMIIAAELRMDVNDLRDGANIIRDYGADSLDVLEICIELEREFQITISDVKQREISESTIVEIAQIVYNLT